MQNAHRIGFDIGIIDLALTPDFLDSAANIVSAHKVKCNKERKTSCNTNRVPVYVPNLSSWPVKLPWPPGRRGRAHSRSTSPGRVKRTVLTTACGSSCQ